MNLINMGATVYIVAGHTPEIESIAEPEWTGTLGAFWSANEDVTEEEVVDLVIDGFLRIGGGAQGCFTVMTRRVRTSALAKHALATAEVARF